MKRILITGIPGTGKTIIGEYLEKNYNFVHYDAEFNGNISKLFDIPETLTELLKHEQVVITWGFAPFYHTNAIRSLIKRGFKLIWFDGDRTTAYKAYMAAGRDENAFRIQIWNICASKIIEILHPIVINCFDSEGNFKEKDTVIAEIINNPSQ